MKHLVRNLFLVAFAFSCHFAFGQAFEPVSEIPEGKGLVYIYRPGSMVGAAVHYTVNANEEKVSEAHLRNKTYLAYIAEPGRYTFWASVSGNRKEAELDVEAGGTYYVKGNCCEFFLPTNEEAEKEIVKCKLSVPK